MTINFFFGAIAGGAIFSNLTALFSDLGKVPEVLGQQIPTVANYFVSRQSQKLAELTRASSPLLGTVYCELRCAMCLTVTSPARFSCS